MQCYKFENGKRCVGEAPQNGPREPHASDGLCTRHLMLGTMSQEDLDDVITYSDGLLDGTILFTGRNAA